MTARAWTAAALAVAAAGTLGWLATHGVPGRDETAGRGERGTRPVPVEAAAIERGAIELRRTYTATMEARAEFVAAPKVSGRIEELGVDLADTVTRGQVVAKLDDDEFVQAVAQAEADWSVAKANLAEAHSQLAIAERELQRVEKLRERGVSSESQRDVAKADQLAKQAHVQVTRAQLTRAEAALETARIRLGYTRVTADWHGGDDRRVVAERYVDEGETVASNTPLVRIVELDPIIAVFFVTEREYGRLATGQRVGLETDAYPGERFPGSIARIAPVFRESTRQARVEVRVDNPRLRLKPGMFARASVVLDRVEDAIVVPEQALVRRDDRDGVFVLAADGASAAWREVRVGIREGERVQIHGDGLVGSVVTLGQQLLDDGSPVTVAGGSGKGSP